MRHAVSTQIGPFPERFWPIGPVVVILRTMVVTLRFDDLAKLSVLRKFSRLAWRLFGVNIALISRDGSRGVCMGNPRNVSRFCKALHRQEGGRQRCMDCDREHLQEAMAQRRPLRYRCYAGLTEFIIPIFVDGDILAFLQCGQVLDTVPKATDWRRIRTGLLANRLAPDPLEDLFYRIRVVAPAAQKDLVELLALFGAYVADSQHQLRLMNESRHSRIVALARSRINSRFSESLSLDQLARSVHASKRNLVRVFRDETGMTVLQTIHHARIAQACDHLRRTDLTCAQIAHQIGFGSVQQFNRIFKRLKGMSPSAWRKTCSAPASR